MSNIPNAWAPPQDVKPPWSPSQNAATQPFQAPKKSRLGLKLFIIGLVLTVLIIGALVALVVFYVNYTSSSAQDNVPAHAQAGQCYDKSGSKQPVSCDDAHHFEVFGEYDYESTATYPDVFDRTLGTELCDEDFKSFTGEGYFASDYDYHEVYPTEEAWNGGNHSTVCVLFHPELRSLPGPVGEL